MVHRREGLLDRCLPPGVHLPQVDPVGAEPLQRGVQVGQHGPRRGVHRPFPVAYAEAGLGGDDQVLAVELAGHQRAEDLLRVPGAVRRGSVDQGATRVDERRHQVVRRLGGCVAAPGERAQSEAGDLQPGRADASLFHARDSRRPTVTRRNRVTPPAAPALLPAHRLHRSPLAVGRPADSPRSRGCLGGYPAVTSAADPAAAPQPPWRGP
ncbi:hypothetical protein SDC9_163110 [bioreactor metagenome]|uniref:Uncharacterized protein n=1 Tax=bioreactor metagenome TaxID=1076179 RepID=A0A645FUT9_9ZZZZ